MTATSELLAIKGGKPVRSTPLPSRKLYGKEEKLAVAEFFKRQNESPMGYNGPFEKAFEDAFSEWMGGGFSDGVNSGTTAVFVALGALELPAGSEVIIPPVTDPGGCMPVALLNCIPVQADSAPGSYNMGPAQFEAVITDKTRAVIVAHIAGIPADVAGIIEIAQKHDIAVIEDCAQAHGARVNGRLVGTWGDIATFSTMFAKNIATGGQGGVVYTKDEELHWKARRFADRGKPFNLESKTNILPSLNFNLNDIAAAIGVAQLKKLPDITARRRKVAAKIQAGAKGLAIQPACEIPGAESSYHFLPMRITSGDKDAFAEALHAEGVSVNASYNNIPADFAWFKDSEESSTPYFYKGKVNTNPVIDNIRDMIQTHLNIYIHEDFDQQAIDDIVTAMAKVDSELRE